jgi:transcription elongation GreA/GreB family factor
MSTSGSHSRPTREAAGGVVRIGSCVRIQDADGDAEFSAVELEEADAGAKRVSAPSPAGTGAAGPACR